MFDAISLLQLITRKKKECLWSSKVALKVGLEVALVSWVKFEAQDLNVPTPDGTSPTVFSLAFREGRASSNAQVPLRASMGGGVPP